MKKTVITALACLAGLTFQSCQESDSHELRLLYPNNKVCYADDVEDSIIFTTMDSYVLNSPELWLSLSDGTHTVSKSITHSNNTIYECLEKVNLLPNGTGQKRLGRIDITSYEYICSAYFIQRPVFNYGHPFPYWNYGMEPEEYPLELMDSATTTTDSICFEVRRTWDLRIKPDSVDIDWVTLSEDNGPKGKNKVTLTLQPNTTTKERKAQIELTSSGVTNTITLTQLGE